jgi:hypothetical protein
LAHIAASPHEGLLGTPAQRPGAQDAWLNIIASRYRAWTAKNSATTLGCSLICLNYLS